MTLSIANDMARLRDEINQCKAERKALADERMTINVEREQTVRNMLKETREERTNTHRALRNKRKSFSAKQKAEVRTQLNETRKEMNTAHLVFFGS
ncbi:hypothetical protein [Spartinivicinus poritis]|uniref:Uncharacterized protein n=1 Tax=Spartinivicinus poritis TaxID=2994640 RepID=A0ABT5UH88_9GAMM|nr:hypothetical protein [Spartinivicinus sp. A2-2]MDE1465677.1 hypothetical protein [Spartinivicinus sp. A2-2]